MPTAAKKSVTIWIVDPAPQDYAHLVESARHAGVHVYCLPTGEAVLRAAKHFAPDLWIIHVALPDMSGFDLVELLGPRLRTAGLFLVADVYAEADEIRTAALGRAMYLCKPASLRWLSSWRCRPRETGAATDGHAREIGRSAPGLSGAVIAVGIDEPPVAHDTSPASSLASVLQRPCAAAMQESLKIITPSPKPKPASEARQQTTDVVQW
jgi:CheY-like chemotaxis protein